MANQYDIRIKGHLDPSWVDDFNGMTMVHHEDGTTQLHGSIPDQAALHGILARIRDLGLTLMEVKREESDDKSS